MRLEPEHLDRHAADAELATMLAGARRRLLGLEAVKS